ncbi:FixH family protein [Neolewinella persica]|uniref:FixH family protein n=1 Tax=Neolewinella persica TaxID=70998 RepID=UPI00035C7ABF|nr:FixH family protein [Neolewinella persica]
MKFHWGHGIAVFYSFFVLTLIFVVIKSRTFDNSLVTEEYYAHDINYQQEYDRRQNSSDLAQGVRLEKTADNYRVVFPEALAPSAKGTLLFYRPSSKLHDRLVKIRIDETGGMNLSLSGLEPGRYRAILEWSAAGKDYLDEFTLTV